MTPDKLAQQVARHHRAGMGADQHKATLAFALQPFGQRLLAVLQQEAGGRCKCAQARRQRPQLGELLAALQRLHRVVLGDLFNLRA